MRSRTDAVVSAIARVEVPAALWRKHRLGELSLGDASVLVRAFESEWFGDDAREGLFAIVALCDAVLEEAARATAVHGLRAYDGVQLASALVARSADPAIDEFLCFDAALAGAARVEGFRVLP